MRARYDGDTPMLILRRQQVIGDAQQSFNRDAHARFFIGFADRAILYGLEKINFAAENAPATRFRRRFAERQQNAFMLIDE